MRGLIFDIRRFSVHDGSGIRTTVFLKGCPLSCVWCQNPEGLFLGQRPMYEKNTCIHCGICTHMAKQGGMSENKNDIVLDQNKDEDWFSLIEECPSGALRMDSRFYEVWELVEELKKDQVFFRENGGVTLSGGEPLLQEEFVLELLKQLHDEGIHTAIETALHIPTETLENVIPYLDLIYADMKLADEKKHREYTGVSNGLIKQNLIYLLTSPYRHKVIIRTPLIPEYTATEENLKEIAQFLSGLYPNVSYELLNYNPLAGAKYPLDGREYCFKKDYNLYKKEEMEVFKTIVKNNGITCLVK